MLLFLQFCGLESFAIFFHLLQIYTKKKKTIQNFFGCQNAEIFQKNKMLHRIFKIK
jgi:hypothetical protein